MICIEGGNGVSVTHLFRVSCVNAVCNRVARRLIYRGMNYASTALDKVRKIAGVSVTANFTLFNDESYNSFSGKEKETRFLQFLINETSRIVLTPIDP